MTGEVRDDPLRRAPGSALQDRVGYRMIKLGEMLMSTAEAALAPLGVRPRHFNVLATIASDESLSQQGVCRLLGIDPNVMVDVVDDLEKLGLAERRRNPQDRRRHVIVLTAAGRTVLAEGAVLLDRAEARFFDLLSADELSALADATGHLYVGNRARI